MQTVWFSSVILNLANSLVWFSSVFMGTKACPPYLPHKQTSTKTNLLIV